jgi:hypothetical protein
VTQCGVVFRQPVEAPTATVRSVRDRIEAVVSSERRRAILGAFECFEPVEVGVQKYRRARSPSPAGAELLAAIDALDRACVKGTDADVEATGERLIELWRRLR